MSRFVLPLLLLFCFQCSSTVAQLAAIQQLLPSDCVNSADIGNYFINSCEEKCVCEELSTGQFAHVCYREREEFTCMSATRRQRFLDAYKAISTPGNPQYSQFEQLIAIHNSATFGLIHSTQHFLAWHRWFAMALEDLLRNEDCRVTVPWWRWSKKSANWWTGTPFHPGSTWLGTDGVSPSQCVLDGAFASWAPPTDTCLKHNFQFASMPTTAQIASVLNTPASSFSAFSDNLEDLIHNLPHVRIGGHMVSLNSPRSPVFFLHHGYMDQLWDRWQRKSPAHLTSYGSFPMNQQLVHTYGGTPSNVQDHFDLKASRVIYVNVKSSSSGGIIALPKCLWIAVSPVKFFSLADLEDGIDTMANESTLAELPQRPYEVKSLEEMERDFAPWFKDMDRRVLLEKFETIRRDQIAFNEQLKAPVEGFGDEASEMLGFDLHIVAAMNNICPIGETLAKDGRTCIVSREGEEQVKERQDEFEVVGGEVVSIEDLGNGKI